jgi:hypothetical protein
MLCHFTTPSFSGKKSILSLRAASQRGIVQVFTLAACAVLFSLTANAQTSFVSAWKQRVGKTVATQPAWPVPVVTPSSGLVQLARFDAVRQITSTHTETWVYGNGKGFDFIPWYKTEFDITLPSYIEHNSAARDGAGEWFDFAQISIPRGRAQ